MFNLSKFIIRKFAQLLRLNHNNGNKESTRLMTLKNINPHIKIMQYAVRGPIVIRAAQLENELRNGVQKPFKEILRTNTGDAQALGQKPITFLRQVLALVTYPELIKSTNFNEDIKERARMILSECNGQSVGAYTESTGIEVIRKHIAEFIEIRDGGISANSDNIFLCGGVSEGVRMFLKMIQDGQTGKKHPACMIPIPQYPLYSASLAEFNIKQIGYYLNESCFWSLDITELERSIKEARLKYNPKLIVVINPGNPTGQVLTRKNIEDIIQFAHNEKLVIMADEVYQENVYGGIKFVSFKKVMMEMGPPYNNMELISFHSASKGYTAECGLRGGYAELVNFDPAVMGMILKSISAKLCSTVLGQVAMDCVINPPKEGDPSYELFYKEKMAIMKSLEERAILIAETFNTMPGITSNPVQGALYAFPKISIPDRAVNEAIAKGIAPDVLYTFQLLETTGCCVIPGSGFGQLPGTFHFRTTIVPPKDDLVIMLEKFKKFQIDFMEKYS